MPDTLTIPILPCVSLPDTLAFYRPLGFEVTHSQTRPNVYLALRRDDLQLHFMGLRKLVPAQAYSACLVCVSKLEPLYESIVSGLRSQYGKLPVKGIPRVSRLRPGASRFTLVDVAGNSLIFVRRDAPDDYDESLSEPMSETLLGRAHASARRLRDFRNDDRAAAKLLDAALAKANPGEAAIDRARALAARAELALVLGESTRAVSLRAELCALELTDAERERHRQELEACDRLAELTKSGE